MSYFSKSGKEISLSDATTEFKKVKSHIKELMYKLGDECENITFDRDDLDQGYFKNQYSSQLDKLEEVYNRLEYLSNPVIEQGFLKHNEDERYSLPSGRYFTSGSTCEILYNDVRSNEQYWIFTGIEHNGEDYYATSLGRNVPINGLMARIRG